MQAKRMKLSYLLELIKFNDESCAMNKKYFTDLLIWF